MDRLCYIPTSSLNLNGAYVIDVYVNFHTFKKSENYIITPRIIKIFVQDSDLFEPAQKYHGQQKISSGAFSSLQSTQNIQK